MDHLCDEIIQIILNELDDPTNFSLTSKHLYAFTQDPYVRSSYFLSRYGRMQALYWALGRGRLMTPKVIDTLLSSGAHISRYFVQCAMHHYYRTAQVPFVKTPWVRSMGLSVFTHFQCIAVRMYGNIPLGKGDDDGSIIEAVIKDSRFPVEQRTVKWESLKEILEKYKFIPFCNKDAMMANFPLVLAIEPRLLPYARANGFAMDHKYRNFVFRKMFEKPAIAFEGRTEEIVRNVRELSRLDSRMYLSRTVAAEICMEVKQNEPAYNALKRLDKEGLLRFEVSAIVEELIKTFAKTRSITFSHTFGVLRQLFADYPSDDPTVRIVLLLQVFISESTSTTGVQAADTPLPRNYVEVCKEKIESIGLAPVKRADLIEVLSSKFTPEKFRGILDYGRFVLGMSKGEVEDLAQEVAFKCLEIGCKGKMLQKLVELYPFITDAIRVHVLKTYRLDVSNLPSAEDVAGCTLYEAPLCQDFVMPRLTFAERIAELAQRPGGVTVTALAQIEDHERDGELREDPHAQEAGHEDEDDDLGYIGQDSLSTMIRKDELGPARTRRRFYDVYANYQETTGKLTYPADNMMVGRWVRLHYGLRSAVTAVFMIHAIVNINPMVVQPYIAHTEPEPTANRVPLTLKHFKLLARLGRAPPPMMVDDIENGCAFYFTEEDYLPAEELSLTPSKKYAKRRHRSNTKHRASINEAVKTEKSASPVGLGVAGPSSAPVTPTPSSGKKRPRRSAAASTKKYVDPDSDDDMIVDDCDKIVYEATCDVKKRRVETSLQKWIKHLTALLQVEQKKVREQKKVLRASALPGAKIRVAKNDFVKHMSSALVRLRKTEKERRQLLYGADAPEEEHSSGEEDEYHDRASRSKRRKVAHAE